MLVLVRRAGILLAGFFLAVTAAVLPARAAGVPGSRISAVFTVSTWAIGAIKEGNDAVGVVGIAGRT
jgi:hypothetical protein